MDTHGKPVFSNMETKMNLFYVDTSNVWTVAAPGESIGNLKTHTAEITSAPNQIMDGQPYITPPQVWTSMTGWMAKNDLDQWVSIDLTVEYRGGFYYKTFIAFYGICYKVKNSPTIFQTRNK